MDQVSLKAAAGLRDSLAGVVIFLNPKNRFFEGMTGIAGEDSESGGPDKTIP